MAWGFASACRCGSCDEFGNHSGNKANQNRPENAENMLVPLMIAVQRTRLQSLVEQHQPKSG
jgi:hypothetical protein